MAYFVKKSNEKAVTPVFKTEYEPLLCVDLHSEQNTSHSSSNSLIEAGCQRYGCAVLVMGFHLSLNQRVKTKLSMSYDLTRCFAISMETRPPVQQLF